MHNEHNQEASGTAAPTNCCNEAQTAVPAEFDIDNLFTYHQPTRHQQEQYEAIRGAAKLLAHVIVACVPKGADKSAAMRKLRECVMTANAGIATSRY